MLEELKAQSAALYFTDWLVEKGVIDRDYAKKAHSADIIWSFGHIAQGMYGSHGESKAYSQLSAVQLGFLMDHQADRKKHTISIYVRFGRSFRNHN